MKLTDIIPKQSSIIVGKTQFFIAANDFDYNGLPILKDSIVYYYSGNIKVNLIGFGIFQDSNIPKLIAEKLPEDEHRNYIVEKCGLCKYEIEKLKSDWRGIWHNDHFDEWNGTIYDLPDVMLRVKEMPSLEFSGITFSSLYYTFNTNTRTLDFFINTKPLTLEIKGKKIILPAYLEIGVGKNSYDITPLETIEYQGELYKGWCNLSEDGVLSKI